MLYKLCNDSITIYLEYDEEIQISSFKKKIDMQQATEVYYTAEGTTVTVLQKLMRVSRLVVSDSL